MTMLEQPPIDEAPQTERASAVGPPEVVDVRRAGWRLWMGIGILVVLLGFVIWAQVDNLDTATSLNSLPNVEVPSVVGIDGATAQKKLEDLGFVVDVKNQPNEDASKPKGYTFGQEPTVGTKVEQGGVVTITVSSGPAGLTVPGVEGQQLGDAEQLLAANGLRSTFVQVADEKVPAGEVMSIDPDPGTQVPVNTQVTLTVSSGPAPRVVPDIMGKDITQALVALGRSGLGIGAITRTYRPGQQSGVVIGMDPPAGTAKPRDWPVKLTVTAPPPSSTVPTLVGLSQDTATSLVQDAGLVPQVTTTPFPPGDPQIGRVVSQAIPPFGSVPTGTTVQFVVGAEAATSPTVPGQSTTTTGG